MNKKGFTLIELLIVVAIIGIVAAIAIPNLLTALQKGKQKATMGDMKSIGSAVEAYMADIAIVPQTGGGLPYTNYFTPFYIKVLPRSDGWGNAFRYTHGTVGSNGDIYSIGSGGRNDFGAGSWTATGDYLCTSLEHFNYDIVFSNGLFTYGPRVKN